MYYIFHGHIDTILEYNYCIYQNDNYSNKWFYAFIANMKYINDNNTEITIKTDVFQTWQFDIIYKNSFIEREHVNNDTIGLNTVDENLNIGDLISDYNYISNIIGAESYFWFVIASNYQPAFGGESAKRYSGVKMYGDYPQGCTWFAWLINYNSYATDINEISSWLEQITIDGEAESIQGVFALPYDAFSLTDIDANTHKVINGHGNKINSNESILKSVLYNFSDYQNVKNNKLYCYPYNFIRVTNNAGNYNDYKIEDFENNNDNDIKFNIIGIPCFSYSGKLRPVNYKGINYNEDESLSLGKYPMLSWSTDAFINWLTQNAVNITGNALASALGLSISAVTGNAIGAGISFAGLVAGTIGQINNASFIPNNVEGNANMGDVNFAFNLLRFKFMKMRAKTEYLKIIDDFFSMFGYKINVTKLPNIIGRRNWNYVKTIDINLLGNLPQEDLEEIKGMFNNGLTLWHNTNTFLDYSQINDIV